MSIFFTYSSDGKNIEHETKADGLRDVLLDFQYFLKGIGYEFDGSIDIVDHQDYIEDKSHHDELEHANWLSNAQDEYSNNQAAQISDLEELIKTNQAKIAELEEKYDKAIKINQDLENRLSEKSDDVIRLCNQFNGLNDSFIKSRSEIAGLEEALKIKNIANQELDELCTELEETISNSQEIIMEQSMYSIELEKKNKKLKRKLKKLKSNDEKWCLGV